MWRLTVLYWVQLCVIMEMVSRNWANLFQTYTLQEMSSTKRKEKEAKDEQVCFLAVFINEVYASTIASNTEQSYTEN